jgi:predicted alpha/beta hydrolase
MHKVTVATLDGFELPATAFGDPQRARVGRLIVAAMGVEQSYDDVARCLAAQGLLSLSSRFRLPATNTCRGAMS